MRRFMLGIVVLCARLETGEAAPKVRSDVSVLLSTQGEDAVPGPVWRGVKTTVSSVFANVGLRVIWENASGNSDGSENQLSIQVQIAARLSPTLQERGPTCADAVAFACSWPFDVASRGRIVVMYERLRPLSLRPGLLQPLLSYLIAHEIAHVVGRRADHSECGIMRRHWDAADFVEIENARLTFTPRDIGFMEEGLNYRFRRP
jgi:hypothetical protein